MTPVNDLARSGIEISKKPITTTVHTNGLQDQENLHLTAAGLKYVDNNLEKDYAHWKHIL